MSLAPFVMSKADSAFSHTQRIESNMISWRLVNPATRRTYGVDSIPRSAREQAEILEQKRRECGELRAWMRAEELDPAKWDSRCSKSIKLLDLNDEILARVDPFSISSIKDAGAIVDA